MTHDHDISRFKKLFRGNPEAYGVYTPATKKSQTVRHPAQIAHYEMHLQGNSRGLGVIPVIDYETSWFGVLDYDNHKKEDAVNIIALEKKIRQIGAPLVVCRSKSGGAHVFLFGSKPLNTKVLRQTMNNYAEQLKGFGEVEIEIFPKQNKVDKHLVGNWINLPYFNSTKTERYAIIDGKKASFKTFLAYSESVSIDNTMLIELGSEVHKDAPPCIERLLKERLGEGSRNIALYGYCVYVKKAFPATYQNLVYKYNAENFEEPLKHDEVTSVINSVDKSDYKYKCQEEPFKSRCDSNLCVIRKFGITPQDRNEIVMNQLPTLGKLIKYTTDPVHYELEIEGKTLKLSSQDLLQHNYFRKVVFEQLDKVIKPLKQDVWLEIIDKLIKNVEIRKVAEEDASIKGMVKNYLREYLYQCKDLTSDGEDKKEREHLKYRPVVQVFKDNIYGKRRYILLRSMLFRQYLKSKSIGTIINTNIYMHIKDFPCYQKSVHMPDNQGKLKVWAIPLVGKTTELDIFTYDQQYNVEDEEEIEYEDIEENKTKIEYNKEEEKENVIVNKYDIAEFEPEF